MVSGMSKVTEVERERQVLDVGEGTTQPKGRVGRSAGILQTGDGTRPGRRVVAGTGMDW